MFKLTLFKRDFEKKIKTSKTRPTAPYLKLEGKSLEFIKLSTLKQDENPTFSVIIDGVKYYYKDDSIFNFDAMLKDNVSIQQTAISPTVTSKPYPDFVRTEKGLYHPVLDKVVSISSTGTDTRYDGLFIFESDGSFSRYATIMEGDAKTYYPVIHSNENIYMMPMGNGDRIYEFDFTDFIQTTKKIVVNESGNDFSKSCLHPNGNIYTACWNSNYIMVYNPQTNIVEKIEITLQGTNKHRCIAIGSNKNIYAFPYGVASALEIDPVSKIVTHIGTGYGNDAVDDVVVFGDGIYTISYSRKKSYKLNVKDKTITTVREGIEQCRNIKITPDGQLSYIRIDNYSYLHLIKIDPKTLDYSSNLIFATKTFATGVSCVVDRNGKTYIISNNCDGAVSSGFLVCLDYGIGSNISLYSPYF